MAGARMSAGEDGNSELRVELDRLRQDYARLEREAAAHKRAAGRLTARDAVTRVLAESASLAEAAPKILQRICENLDWQMGALWSVNQESNMLHFVESWHAPNASIPSFEATTRKLRFARGVGMPGRVWSTRQPAWIPDVLQDKNFPRAPLAAQEG